MAKVNKTSNKTTNVKNRLPKKMYKERGQLSDRKHLGVLLEKKKDYQRRSANFKQKSRIIGKFASVF